jgi:predicted AAA+ superfamily ATPase
MDTSEVLRDQNPHWSDPAARRARGFRFERVQLDRCEAQLADASSGRALALIGPRHVGKTVLLRQVADRLLDRGLDPRQVVYCNLADERWVDPPSPREVVRVAQAAAGAGATLFVLLDEIQVVPKWHTWLKLAVDEKQHRFLVTGSAASSLRQGARESGLGRWDELSMESLSFAEFSALTRGARKVGELVERRPPNTFERYLALSGFPAHAFTDSESRVRERLREDIVERAIVRDLQRLRVDVDQARRLFLYLAENSGGILNAQKRAQDLGVNRKSLSKWLDHLLDTRLLVALPSTTTRQGRGAGKAARTLQGRAKVHVADHGLVSAFAPVPSPLTDPHFRAQMFEAVVFRHLREAQRAVREDAAGYVRHGEVQLSYWRDNSGEVDFIADSRRGRVAIEVATSAKPDGQKLAKFRAAAERAGATRSILVCGAFAASVVEGIEVMPIEEFVTDPVRYVEVEG